MLEPTGGIFMRVPGRLLWRPLWRRWCTYFHREVQSTIVLYLIESSYHQWRCCINLHRKLKSTRDLCLFVWEMYSNSPESRFSKRTTRIEEKKISLQTSLKAPAVKIVLPLFLRIALRKSRLTKKGSFLKQTCSMTTRKNCLEKIFIGRGQYMGDLFS